MYVCSVRVSHGTFLLPFYLDKHMREWLAKLMDCGYFDQVVLPKDKKEPESHVKPGGLAGKAGNDQR